MILNVGGTVVAQTSACALSAVSSNKRARFINKRLDSGMAGGPSSQTLRVQRVTENKHE